MTRLRLFLMPGIDPVSGEPFQVWIPSKGRNIKPDGETVAVDSYVSRRIISGELVSKDKPEEAPTDAPADESKPHTAGPKKDSKNTKPTGGN